MLTERLVARPTTYNGIRMRSRLEARFAAFLDRAGFDWEYEPRAFASARGQYLPDFVVRDSGSVWDPLYVEIKGDAGGSLEPHFDKLRIIHQSEPLASLALIERAWMERRHAHLPRLAYFIVHPDLLDTRQEPDLGGVGLCSCGVASFFPFLWHGNNPDPFFICRRGESHMGPVAYLDPFA